MKDFLKDCWKYSTWTSRVMAFQFLLIGVVNCFVPLPALVLLACVVASIIVMISDVNEHRATEALDEAKAQAAKNREDAVEHNQEMRGYLSQIQRVHAQIVATDSNAWVKWWRDHGIDA